MTAYTDQAQERLDRLERMEPVFEALREALQAIEARHNGEYDLPALMKQGPLSTSTHDDVIRIARAALALAEEVGK